jgi:hypothetical protein
MLFRAGRFDDGKHMLPLTSSIILNKSLDLIKAAERDWKNSWYFLLLLA